MKQSFFILLVILQFLTCSIIGQINIPFFRIGTAQGLSQSTVFCSFQDSKGYIWFGTSEGLNRYDGYNFKIFRQNLKDKNSLISNDILSISEDSHGNIWIGTRTRGVSILDIETFKFDNTLNFRKDLNIGHSGISTIIADDKKNIWFSAVGIGLFMQDHQTGKILKINNTGFQTKNISAAYKDNCGNLWFGNQTMQIARINPFQKFSVYSIPDLANKPNWINGLAEGNSGKLYITTGSNGLYVLDKGSHKFSNAIYNKNIIGGENNMKSIVKTDNNDLIIATDNGLIIVPNEKTEEYSLQKANSSKRFALSTHALTSILLDKNQNIWIGTWEGGINVNYKKQPPFNLLRQEAGVVNGPLERKITSVATNNKTIWLGTNIGLSEFNRANLTWKHYNENQLSGSDINSMKFDRDGDLFVSAYQKNLNVYFKNSTQFKQYNYKVNLTPQPTSISAFAQESNGKMWIGTYNGGILLFDKKTGSFSSLYKKFPKLNWNLNITSLLEDDQNQLWVGTFSSGLYVLNLKNNTYKTFRQGDGKGKISDDHILSIAQDKNDNIWIGTNGSGLNLFDEKNSTFKTILEQDGLPNNTIKSIIEDQKGNLWLSTNQGICKFNYKENTFKSYSEEDGLQSKEFGRTVGAINQNGELFFGGMNGLSYFDPKNLPASATYSPKIVFSNLKLYNKNVEVGDKNSPLEKNLSLLSEITLKNNQSVFNIEYLALDFQQLKNYQYAYKLEGFDNDWNYVGTQRSAPFTNLHEGNYTLKVKSTNNDGFWCENIATLKIKILPPWYRTILAYIAYCILLGLLLYFWRRIIKTKEKLNTDIRIQKIEAQKIKELEVSKSNFFTNISHEFRTPLTLIISPLQQLMQNSSIANSDINKQHGVIMKNAQRLLRLINQILDISKLEAGNMKLEISKNDLVEFLNSIAFSFKVLAEKNNINYTINNNNNQRYGYFDKDIIEKVTYNLLSNAFKFTEKNGEIQFNINLKNNQLRLEVSDTGIGMDSETTDHIFDRYYQAGGIKERKTIGTGIGLALTKELVELHLGSIDVESEPKKGSKFIVEIPVSATKYEHESIKEDIELNVDLFENFSESSIIPNHEINLEDNAPLLLIVEDNDELREYIVGLFENKYKILEAENGSIGLDIATEYLPDLIISDFIMPVMDGGEFCKAIKTNEKTSHIPFFILTSKQNSSTIENSFENGADDYIIKPFNNNILLKRVESTLKSRESLKAKFGKALNPIPEGTLQNETEQRFFNKVISIIENNIEDGDFDVTKLEESLNMSKMQLYRKLKGVSTLAPNEFIRNIRLKKALSLFKNTDQNVSEVAYAVGFNDPAYFTRCFKKEFGKAPTEFINRKAT